MITRDVTVGIESLRELFEVTRRIVPFTGAGISTECGIPDFRSPGGYWTRNQPIPYDAFLASQKMRDESWRRRFAIDPQFRAAKPGQGHRALAALYRAGKCPAVITQNIDGLQQAAGMPADDVIELHGSTTYASCLGCAKRYEIDWVRERFETDGQRAPDCPDCGAPIKTATISFGQPMPQAQMRRAEQLARDCDLFLAIGSSLVVWPAAGLPLLAKREGARLIIINREPTDLDDAADLVIRGEIANVLGPFSTA